MSMTASASASPSSASLVSLVLQSKKALHHGGELCQRANSVVQESAQCAVDVLALDAKIRFVVHGVLTQLDAARVVAKTVEEKRKYVAEKVNRWDTQRLRRCEALDDRLERLGQRRVPSGFWKPPEDEVEMEGANIFGEEAKQPVWKTLRDFIDEHAIEDVVELMDNERTALDLVITQTEAFPETLNSTISAIGDSLYGMTEEAHVDVPVLIHAQDTQVHGMAHKLESLTGHYENMKAFEEDTEEPGEEDRQAIERDTAELPSIIGELEHSVSEVERIGENLKSARANSETHIQLLSKTVADLDELADIMFEIVSRQDNVENESTERLEMLDNHLYSIEEVSERLEGYEGAFNGLVGEIERRTFFTRRVREVVTRMDQELRKLWEEESGKRIQFNENFGVHLPDDICLCVGNTPTRWEVVKGPGEKEEWLPDINVQ